jgi:coenzyme F420-reducing hydrogenase delta subunit
MFALDKSVLSYPVDLGDGAFAEGSLSANAVVSLVQRLLPAFGLESSAMTIELR